MRFHRSAPTESGVILRSFADHSSPRIRVVVAAALGTNKQPADENALIALSRDPHPSVRFAAVRGLSGHQTTPAQEAQRFLCEDLDPKVREEAKRLFQ